MEYDVIKHESDLPTDDERDSADSECSEYPSDDEECVDILNVSPDGRRLDEEEERGATTGCVNNFSINRILGIKDSQSGCVKDNEDRESRFRSDSELSSKFIKPTPIQVSPRNGKNECLNFLVDLFAIFFY